MRGGDAEQALVEELAQLAERAEDLDAEHQDDEQLGDPHRAALDAEGADAQGDGCADRDREDREALRQGVVHQHAHRGAEDLPGALGQRIAAAAALAERLERREPLQRIEEICGERAVGVAAAQAGGRVAALQQRGQREREERDPEEDAGHGQVEEHHEGEDADRRDRGDDQLRQVLAEVGLELLDALHDADRDIAGALAVEVRRAERHDAIEEPLAQAELDLHRGAVGQLFLGIEKARTRERDHRGGDDQRRERAERFALEDARGHPAQQGQPGHACGDGEQAEHHGERDP